jgi:hypothetical protein
VYMIDMGKRRADELIRELIEAAANFRRRT